MSVTHLELLDQMGDYPTPFSKNDTGDDDEDDEEDDDGAEGGDCDDPDEDVIPKIRIGVCAMNKKTNSQPMQEILGRMSAFDFVDIFIFPDDTILNVSVDEWPICDCLICFYSQGFPLEKAIEYAKLRKPFTLNDLQMQYALLDRPTMYSHLENAGIETPRHAILIRDGDGNPVNTRFIELDDSVQIGDVVFQKPFVEKPVNAEDHNVYIYFPSGAGGGSQRLFRKVGNRSSVYSAESSVRKKGSYIYEDFVVTDGTDVKVYAVGPEYAHAEARKSPSLDGKVERDSQGKEIRYPVILNAYEKELANKVCKLFKQTVCGCDLLRTQGKSYVCDVNGFSFVKTSKKYYDDAAQVLMSLIVQELAPQLYKSYNLDVPEDIPTVEALEGTMLELRCVVGVIRHGDRTPKQKMKMEVRHSRFIQLFKKYNGFDEQKLKLKRPTQLQEVLNIARDLLAEIKDSRPVFESPNKLHQLKSVLEMYGYFSGINRKIQFKYLGKPRDESESESSENRQEDSESDERSTKRKEAKEKESKSKETLGKEDKEANKKASKEFRSKDLKEIKGKEPTNVETKEGKLKDESDMEHSLLLILKWGGELTAMGKEQALQLGRAFRSVYPTGQGQYSTLSGYGLLRLHSTYRHDLKIYASDEGRVQMTAAAFAKGFLALEGELTPILVHLVRSDKNTTEMLDTSDDAAKIMGKVKHKLHDILHSDEDFKEEDFSKLVPTKKHSVINAMKLVKNSKTMCEKLYNLVQDLTGQLKDLIAQKTYDPRDPFLYHDETLELMIHRWMKLEKDFKLKNGHFDISLIPDIYDCIKYDVQHNSKLNLYHCLELYKCAKALADIVIPQEYGITREEKLGIAQRVCTRLLRKIRGDLRHADNSDIHTRLNPNYSQSVETPHRHVRTRLYFTSESHVHTVLNAFQCGKLFDDIPDGQWRRAVDFLGEVPELNYMTQMVIMLYEDPKAEPQSDKRFHVELHFSPGAKTMDDPEFLTRSSPTRKQSQEEVTSSSVITVTHPTSTDSDVKVLTGASNNAVRTNEGASIRDMSSRGGFKASALYDTPVVLAATNIEQSSSSGHSQNYTFKPSTSAIDNPQNPNYIVTKDDCHTVVGDDYGPFDDKPFDESVYAGNERPRCTIGIESFSDSALVASSGDSVLSSGTSIEEEQSGEEKVSVKQWQSTSESELDASNKLVTCSQGGKSMRKEEQRSKSESDMVGSGNLPCKKAESQEFPSVTGIVERNRRRKAHSVSEMSSLSKEMFRSTDTCPSVGDYFKSTDDLNIHKYSSEGIESFLFAVDETVEYDGETNEGDDQQQEDEDGEDNVADDDVDDDDDNNDDVDVDDDDDDDDDDKGERERGLHSKEEDNEKPSSAKSDTTDVRERKVSFEVGRQGKVNYCGQPLRVVQSSPSLKKGSPTRKLSLGSATSAIRAVRNLSYAIQSALVVRPFSFTKSTRDSRKPPIAEFYEEMTKVESLNPLRTLHNAIPLKEMDSFFDRVTEHKSDVLVTPVNTPSRKSVSKKLSTRSSSQPAHLMEKVDTITCEENLEEEDLESEEIEGLDRPP